MFNLLKKFYKYIIFYPESFWTVCYNEILWFMKKNITEEQYIHKNILGSEMLLDLRNKGISHQLAVHGVREISSVIIFLLTLKKGE